MPLLIAERDISWEQTDDQVKIIVPVSSRIDKTISILTSSNYLKLNSPPYIWECFLSSAIDNKNSLSRKDENGVTFELLKKEKKIWQYLSDPNSHDENFRREQRLAAATEIQEQILSEENEKSTHKSEKQRAAVQNQMELQNKERKRIEDSKKLENEHIAKEIEELKKKKTISRKSITSSKKDGKKPKEIPPPRKPGHIAVTFTPRVFPTAARESQEPQEQQWLENQAAARKTVEFNTADLSSEEKNPDWLKQKADSMCRKGDYKSAVNAYTLALQMCPNMYSLYMGRSECHLHLNNLHKCIEDSSKALDLLVPAVQLNAADRLKCHKIRGKGFCKLDLYIEGLMDFEAALKIEPMDERLTEDIIKLRTLIESSD